MPALVKPPYYTILASGPDCIMYMHVQYVQQCLNDDAIIDQTQLTEPSSVFYS